jgi:cytochrome b
MNRGASDGRVANEPLATDAAAPAAAIGTDDATRIVRVWDLPLRLWHWSLVAALGVSLYTGLSGQIHLFDLHAWAGYTVIGLMIFRLGWWCWGGIHARWHAYLTTPRQLIDYARGRHDPRHAHTPPGALMAIALWIAVALQSGSGLFASDFIFNRGPLASHLTEAGVRQATWIHVRAFWVIVALAVVHVLAIAAYTAIRRDALAVAMITGRKPLIGAPTPNYLVRAIATMLAAAWLARVIVSY